MANETDEHGLSESGLEVVESEAADLDTSPASYDIVTYPADFTLEGLVSKYHKELLKAPGFQRKYVWKLPQASKLIESFLLGLPVPAIYLFADPGENVLQVIDGQQRLLSIVYFFDGVFAPETAEKQTVFALTGLHERSPYKDHTYKSLSERDEAAFNRLNDSVLRAFVVKQLNPKDNTSIYHIFERLNTTGTPLVSQEIRNCVYDGPFNDLLAELNCETDWRAIFGNPKADKRQRDVELILRFLALFYSAAKYEKPMKTFLSNFMGEHKRDHKDLLEEFRRIFRATASMILKNLGAKPFHIRAGLNAAAFDCVFVAFAKHEGDAPPDVAKRYARLKSDAGFIKSVSSSTTDQEVVSERLRLALSILFG